MTKRRSIRMVAVLLVVAVAGAVCFFLLMNGAAEQNDTGVTGFDAKNEIDTTKRDESARRRRALAGKRIEAILEGKWIKPDAEEDTSDRQPFPGPCRTRIDTDGDGRPDRIIMNTYNDDGELTLVEIDKDADGQVDKRAEHHMDEQGELSGIIENGEQIFKAERRYDDDGNALEVKIDFQADGEIDATVESTYDDFGNLLTRNITSTFRDADERYTYDASGNLISRKTHVVFNEKNVTENTETRFFYDDNDNLLREVVTGDATRMITFTYDPDGNRLSRVVDEGNDGKPDQVWQYRYDDAGNRLEEEFDKDGDGTVDRREINSYKCWR